jgi:hypothetical protein
VRVRLIDFILAHVLASYGVVLGVTLLDGWQGAATVVLAPVFAIYAMYSVTFHPEDFVRPITEIATVYGTYLLIAVAILRLAHRTRKRKANAAKERCVNCGYDLRATPDLCPECGARNRTKAPE